MALFALCRHGHDRELNLQLILHRTWEICLQRVHKLGALVRFLPRQIQEFVNGISAILEAYGSGDLTYSLIVAEK